MIKVEDQAGLEAAIAAHPRTIVLLHASWCPFCRRFKKAFDRVVAEQSAFTPVEVLLDDERNPLWARHGIEVVPTLLVFEQGRLVRRCDGGLGVGLTEADLRAALG
jgi:thioredoxin 1